MPKRSFPDGQPFTVEPLYLEATAENGEKVRVDVMRMLSTDEGIRKTWEAACKVAFERGYFGDYSYRIGFVILGEAPDDDANDCVMMLPSAGDDTYFGYYSPEIMARPD